ncbi:MAG: hypothetical protein HY321_18580 [Armatimonadetes bacterium]|nr:hypothetical protein [Armatimonadota bacterium]
MSGWGARVLVLGWTCALLLAGASRGTAAEEVVGLSEVTKHRAPLEPGQRLVIRHSYGAVRLSGVDQPEVNVCAQRHVRGVSLQAVRSYLKALATSVQPMGDRVEIETRRPGGDPRFLTQTTVDLDITLPRGTPVELNSSFGDVDAEGIGALRATVPWGAISVRKIAGDVNLEGKAGKVTVADVAGDLTVAHSMQDVDASRIGGSVTIRNQFGQIRVQGVGGRAVLANRGGPIALMNVGGGAQITCQTGQVQVSRVQGGLTVTNADESVSISEVQGVTVIEASNGNVIARQVSGDLKIDNRYGVVDIATVTGNVTVKHGNQRLRVRGVKGSAALSNSHGAIDVDGVAGDCNIHNQFASVTVHRVYGALEVFNAWGLVRADLPAPPARGEAAPWKLKTNNSNIVVGVPEKTGCALSVEVISGAIESQFPVEVQRAGNVQSAQWAINGGGRPVDVVVDLGMAQVQKRPAAAPRPAGN